MNNFMKIALTASLALLITGCSVKDLSTDAEPKIDATLEVIDSNSIRTISEPNAIAFEWQKVDDVRVVGYNFYRTKLGGEEVKLKHIEFVKNRYTTHFVDTKLEPNTAYSYSITSGTKNDYESNPTNYFEVKTLPRPEAVPFIQAISNLPRQIKILWRPHPKESIAYYKVYRSKPSDNEWEKLETIEGRLQAEYIDTRLKDNVVYFYKVVAFTFEDLASEDSQTVQAQTKPLPKGINQLTATQDQPRKITLNWQASEAEDIIGQNIYRNSSVNGSFELIKKLNKDVFTYEDNLDKDGKVYFYKVRTIDKDGLESSKEINATMGMSLPKLNKPVLTLAMIQGEKAILNWQAGDNRAKSYTIYRKAKESFFNSSEKKYTNITDLRFEDNDITRGVEYEYSIESVDEFGISSERTKSTTLILPKLANN